MSKKLLSLFVLGIVLLGLLVTMLTIKDKQTIQRDAKPATTLSLLPSTLSARVKSNFNVNLQIDTGENQVVGVQTILSFDPSIVEAKSVNRGSFIPLPDIEIYEIDNVAGTVSLAVAEPPAGTPRQGVGTVATITFIALSEGSSQITFATGDDTLVAAIGPDTGLNAISLANPATVIVGSTVTPDTDLSFVPRENPVNFDSTYPVSVPVDVFIDTGMNSVAGVELYVSYDNTRLNLSYISAGSFFPNATVQRNIIDQANGTAEFVIIEPPPGIPSTGLGILATLDFSAIAIGDALVSFDPRTLVTGGSGGDVGVNLLNKANDVTIRIQPIATVTLTPTVSPIPTFSPTNTPTPTYINTPSPVPDVLADINQDGCVDLLDYSILYSVFGLTSQDNDWLPWGPLSNLQNQDDEINILDYSILFVNFGNGWSCDIPVNER